MSYIEMEDVRHMYHAGQANEVCALDGVSLAIEAGSFVAVLGTNGSGKSTLAQHLNALLLPTSGTCRVAGMDTKDPTHLWDIRQEVSMVFQNPDNQIIAAVVEEDVAFGVENLGVPAAEIRDRVDAALEAVGMTAFRNFAPHLLSGGQKQRVAIAGAIAMRTKCLVLDEPTAMLDPQGRQEVLSTVRALHDTYGMTIVYITHFMEEAAAADRVIVMDGGKVVADDVPRAIFNDVPAMKARGLEVPVATEVAWRLREQGVPVPEGILTDGELVQALCQSN